MTFMVYTEDSVNWLDKVDLSKQMMYLEEVKAINGHEACKKVRKENPDRVFLGWWKKQ